MTDTKDTRKVVIPESLLYRLINELKLAHEDAFVKSTDELIKEAEKHLYEEF